MAGPSAAQRAVMFRNLCLKYIERNWAQKNLKFLGVYTVAISDASSKMIDGELRQGFGGVVLSAMKEERVHFGRFPPTRNCNLAEFQATAKIMRSAAEEAPRGRLLMFNDNERVIKVLSGGAKPNNEELDYVKDIKTIRDQFESVSFHKSSSALSALSDFIARFCIDEKTGLAVGEEKSATLEDACCDYLSGTKQHKAYGRSVNTYRDALTRWKNEGGTKQHKAYGGSVNTYRDALTRWKNEVERAHFFQKLVKGPVQFFKDVFAAFAALDDTASANDTKDAAKDSASDKDVASDKNAEILDDIDDTAIEDDTQDADKDAASDKNAEILDDIDDTAIEDDTQDADKDAASDKNAEILDDVDNNEDADAVDADKDA